MTCLAAHGVGIAYDGRRVLEGLDLEVRGGETLGVLGPSGCGKSSLVRVLALLQRPTAGHVTVDGVVVAGARHRAPTDLRTRIGLVFQSPRTAVDPRLTLGDVIAEPLRARRRRATADAQVAAMADRMGLTPDLLDRTSATVSEGQLQRACVGRALVGEPAYLLCDEMTSMLDASTQAHLVAVIRANQQETGLGVLVVSHDELLINRWADRVVSIGALGAVGSPDGAGVATSG